MDEIEKFRAADFDNDQKLSRDEFEAFLYPRNFDVSILLEIFSGTLNRLKGFLLFELYNY